jgi:hypothetical protein
MKKFFLILSMLAVAAFVVAFGYSAYGYYHALHSDDPIDPYVSVVSGDATVTRGTFSVDFVESDRYTLVE